MTIPTATATLPLPPFSDSPWVLQSTPLRTTELHSHYIAQKFSKTNKLINAVAKLHIGEHSLARACRETQFLAFISEKRITRINKLAEPIALAFNNSHGLVLKDAGLPLTDMKGRISTYGTLQVARDVLQALHNLGINDIAHTAITPQSVMVKIRADGTLHARLADFENALLLDPFKNNFIHQGYAHTECWSPEIILGAPITTNCDLWGLGITLLEAYLGFNPFKHVPTEPTSTESAANHTCRNILSYLGSPPLSFFKTCQLGKNYFQEHFNDLIPTIPLSPSISLLKLIMKRAETFGDNGYFAYKLYTLITLLLTYPEERPNIAELLCSDHFIGLPARSITFKVRILITPSSIADMSRLFEVYNYLFDIKIPGLNTVEPALTIDLRQVIDEYTIPRSPTGLYEVRLRNKASGNIEVDYQIQSIGSHPYIPGKVLAILV